MELIVLASGRRTAHCRDMTSRSEIILHSRDAQDLVAGEIVTVAPERRWHRGGHDHVSGEVTGRRLDVKALELTPLRLMDRGTWDPAEEYWGEEGEPLDAWARAIIAFGPRPSFEMEQVLPGADPEDWEADPILDACELNAAGDRVGAREILNGLLAADLRCLDAHAHLGNFTFDHDTERALRHYEVGVGIGEITLGEGFGGCLLWVHVDNRPFLRCLHGLGLSLWRLGRPHEAAPVFERMLWLNPTDNQGSRYLLPAARAGDPWPEDKADPVR